MARVEPYIAIAAALPGAALACSPALLEPSEVPNTGPDCAINWAVDEIRAVGLSPATDLGGGLVMQHAFDGNACYWDDALLLQDCAAGSAMLVGPDKRVLMDEPRETGLDRIRATLTGDQGAATLDRVADMARDEGYGAPAALAPGDTLDMNGWPLPTHCACRHFYPDLAGGSSE